MQDTALTPRIFTGTINAFRRNPEGLVNGVVLDSKKIIELPPPATDQLQALLVNGEKIQVTGFAVVPPAGVVMAQEMTTVRPQTITIKGQTYMVR